MEARLGLSEPLRSLQVAQAGPVAEVWLSRERKGNALVRPPTPQQPGRWGNPRRPTAGHGLTAQFVLWGLMIGDCTAAQRVRAERPARSASLASGNA